MAVPHFFAFYEEQMPLPPPETRRVIVAHSQDIGDRRKKIDVQYPEPTQEIGVRPCNEENSTSHSDGNLFIESSPSALHRQLCLQEFGILQLPYPAGPSLLKLLVVPAPLAS